MADIGLTHVALTVKDSRRSVAFYERYANMRIVHRREEHGKSVVWVTDGTRPFVVVLIETEEPVVVRLEGIAHLGVGCRSREEVDRLAALAREEGRLELGPTDSGYPVGYWVFVRDPDGHNLELSFGQEVGLTVRDSTE